MPEFVWYIGFAVSILFTLSFCFLIARGVFRSGVEHFSSRILIFSGIINTSLCSLLFLSQGIYEAIRIATAEPIHLSQLLVPVIFIAVPVRILWNYFSIQQKPVVIHNLQPCTSVEINTEIAALCKTMGISPPATMFSNMIVSPFVFGRRSNMAILAVPGQWFNTKSRSHYVQLLHELSHIRNHDVGFLAWSNAVLWDLRFLLILLPVLAGYCFIIGSSYIVSSIFLYIVCSIILFTMLRYIVRKRESLADLTAAMLVESGQVKELLNSQEIYTGVSGISLEQKIKPVVADKIRRWLEDKAMFSKRQKLWNFLLAIFNFFYLLHPSRPERLKKISSDEIIETPKLPIADSFWAGMAIGLMGAVIGMGGLWFSTSFQHHAEEIDYLKFPYTALGIAAPIAIGYLAVFLALPVWSSLKLPKVDNRFILLLLGRYVVALAGACVISFIILTAGATITQVLALMIICLLWNVFITGFGFGVNIVIVSLWITIRYLQSSHMAELRKSIWAFGLFIIAIFGLIVVGGTLMNNEKIFYGINIIFSTIAGGALVARSVVGSRFSETEEYIILCVPFLVYHLEGKWCKTLVYAIHSVYMTILLFIFASLIYFTIDFTLGNLFRDSDSIIGVIIALAASCAVMVLVERNGLKRISERKRSKINILYHCLKLMPVPIDATIGKKTNKIIKSYDLRLKSDTTRVLNLTMHDAYEIIAITQDDASQKKVRDYILKWVLRCQTKSGFGLWPKSLPRLYSTYQAISILDDTDMSDKCNIDRHTSWIKSLQKPDGSFRGPWSKRDSWQDTFYAAKSLYMLGDSLDAEKLSICKNWCRNMLIEEGIGKDRLDVIYYCFGSLAALDAVDDGISKLLSEQMSSKIEKLLLTNVSLDYENVHFAVMTYNLLDAYPVISTESLILLSDRIKMALNSELADIRIS